MPTKAESRVAAMRSGDGANKSSPPFSNDSPKGNKMASQRISFSQKWNLVLWPVIIFSLFSAFNFMAALPEGHKFKPKPPGEQYWFREGLMKWAMQVHLYTVLPAGMLLPLQFLPVMRRKYMYLHKISGRLLFVLLIIGDITALTIGKHSFGGTIDTQLAVIALSSLTSISIYKAWTSIRNLHIEQHRAWVIRAWSYACSILTLRLFMIIFAISIGKISPNGYKYVTTCEELKFMYHKSVRNITSIDSLDLRYPACAGYEMGTSKPSYIIVNATLSKWFLEERTALINMVFGVSGWAAIALHLALTEIYLNHTKDEDERLRKVSLVRRKAVGLV